MFTLYSAHAGRQTWQIDATKSLFRFQFEKKKWKEMKFRTKFSRIHDRNVISYKNF